MRKFILGTDWWTDCDDCVALRLLSRAAREEQIELLGIGINACMEYSAASVDGFLQQEGLVEIPIGIDLDATDYGGEPPYQKRLASHARRYLSNGDAEDAVRLYRRLLALADTPVEIIEIGFLQVISALLESSPDDLSPLSGLELVRAKVARFWVMGGKWDEDGGEEHNFAKTPRARKAAEAFCRLCPVPITFLGWEISWDVISGDKLSHDDFLYLALKDHGSENGRMSWDPMLAQLALTGSEAEAGYAFVQGFAVVDPETGANHFSPAPNGLHRYVVKARENSFYSNLINKKIRY